MTRGKGITRFFNQTATVETFSGTSGYGIDLFASPITLDPTAGNGCFIDGKRTLVRDKDGQQVISESTLFTYPTNAALFAPDSKVTIGGIVARVITVNANDNTETVPVNHVAVSLT